MGSSNSVATEIQGTYIERLETEVVDNRYTDYSYRLILKKEEFELTQTQTNVERKPEVGGGSFAIAKMALLLGTVEQIGDPSKGEEITIKFKTNKASFQEGGGMMGVPLPDDSHIVDFTMKFNTMMKTDGTTNTNDGKYRSLSFVTYPKLKFDRLTGVLTSK